MKIIVLVLLMAVFVIGLVSCKESPTLLPTINPIQTQTENPKIFTTPTSEPTTTPTAEPTLNAQETRKLVIELLQDNGKCQLPCFLGLTPKKTEFQSLQNFIKHLGNIAEDGQDIYVRSDELENKGGATSINLSENNSRVVVEFYYPLSNGQLKKMIVHTAAYHEKGEGANIESILAYGDLFFDKILEYYLLPQVLLNYGKPSQILILPILEDEPPYMVGDLVSMVLFYPKQGFLVEYIFPINTEGSNYVGCPSKTGYLNLATWSPEREMSLADIAGDLSGRGINEETVNYFKPLEESTSITIDKFYELFKNPQSCLKTSVNLWK